MAGPTLTADTTGNPWVEVFFDPADLHPDAVLLRMYRLAENRTWLVRGGVDVSVGVAALDFECPFNIETLYRAQQYDAAGTSLGYTEATQITLEVDGTWVHNPLDPPGGIEVELDEESLLELSTPTPGENVQLPGRTVGRRIGSRQHGIEGAQLVLNVDGMSNIEKWREIVGGYDDHQLPIVCIRTSDPVLLPRTFFAMSEDWRLVDRTIRRSGEWIQVTASVDETEPPFPGLVTPLLTYDDLDAAYDTYDDRDAAYATYTEQDRDYSLAGFAG